MQLHQSLQMLRNLKEIIEKNDLLSKYQHLVDIFNKTGSKTLSDTAKSKMEESLNQIIAVHQELTAMFWNNALKDFFPKKDIENLIQKNQYDAFKIKPEEYQHIIDYYNNCTSSIKEILETSQKFIIAIEQIKTYEINTVETDTSTKTLSVYFINNTSISTSNELEKYFRIWNNILNSFSNLTKEEDTPIQIQYVDKNNLMVKIGTKTTQAILQALASILNTQRRRLEIKNLKQEIHLVELSNETEFETLIEEELTNVVDEHSSVLTRELMTNYDIDYLQNQKIYDNIQIATKQLLNFIEKGGKIDAKQNNANDELNIINKNIINEFIKIEHIIETPPPYHI